MATTKDDLLFKMLGKMSNDISKISDSVVDIPVMKSNILALTAVHTDCKKARLVNTEFRIQEEERNKGSNKLSGYIWTLFLLFVGGLVKYFLT